MNYTTILINTIIHILLVLVFEGVFLFGILYPILARKVASKTNDFTRNMFIHIWPTIKWDNCNTPNNKPQDLTPYYITPEEYKLIQLVETKEKNYITSNSHIPYIVYGVIMSSLVILAIIIISISRYMNIYVNYKYILINSLIIFLFICGFASSILWFDVFLQDYQINISKPFLQKFLEEYKSL
jgi:hypothetical protein